MSSVLIKGMKMPTTCEECDFCHWSNRHQTGICDRCGDEPVCPDYGTDYRRTRARFCPLIELPEKHGRLIDENEVRTVMNWLLTQPQRPTWNDTYHAIQEMNAVIEAEGDEE